MKALWDQYDTNQNGVVDLVEFTAAVTRMNPALTAHAPSMFHSFDKNNDGVLSFAEFFKMETPYATMKEIKACIAKHTAQPKPEDPSDKYRMTMEEIEEMWEILHTDGAVTFDQILKLCPEFDLEHVVAGDIDDDGCLDHDEFCKLLQAGPSSPIKVSHHADLAAGLIER